MEKRIFEKLGISPSLLGFGCMRFPTTADGKIDEVESKRMIDHAMQSGVTYIDTAYPYHDGESEPFMGKVLKDYNREDFYLATKLPIWEVTSKEHARELFEKQCQRLDVDYIDFYLLHALDSTKWDTVLKNDVLDLVDELKAEGKIKYIGFSFHDEYPVFETIIKHRKWDFCQLQINYMDMDIQAGIRGYDLATKLGVPVIVMEPIKGGSLAMLPDDITSIFKDANPKATLSSWALRYAASFDNVHVVLSGMSTFEHVEDNLATFVDYKNLNIDERATVDKVVDILKSRTQNGCTGCNYCMPCPVNVDIPGNFKYFNNAFVYEDHDKFKGRLRGMEKSAASLCIECGKCETMCPQQIKIREDLKKIVKYLED